MQRARIVSMVLLPVAISCSPSPVSQASPGSAPTPSGQVAATSPASAPAAGETRRRPNPMQQDTVRRRMVDSIMTTIRGREQEPAGTVFKNVKLLKSMPAAEFLRNMDVNYGRGLGMGCGNCHVIGEFDADTRKNKRVARQMQEMVTYINAQQLSQMKELDEDRVSVTCVTCHMGSGHPKDTMSVPMPPIPTGRN